MLQVEGLTPLDIHLQEATVACIGTDNCPHADWPQEKVPLGCMSTHKKWDASSYGQLVHDRFFSLTHWGTSIMLAHHTLSTLVVQGVNPFWKAPQCSG